MAGCRGISGEERKEGRLSVYQKMIQGERQEEEKLVEKSDMVTPFVWRSLQRVISEKQITKENQRMREKLERLREAIEDFQERETDDSRMEIKYKNVKREVKQYEKYFKKGSRKL